MLLKTLRFVSLLCAALALGLTLTHDLEIPAKQMLSGASWLTVQNTFYGGFAIVGGLAEVIGLLATALLLLLLRTQRTAFILTLVATLCFVGMLALFAFGNNPLNQQVASWTPQTLPPNWREVRNAWDGFHAASSVLAALALICLLIAVLRETPSSHLVLRRKTERRVAERADSL
jgi:ribose/xylose/arabinose/galactoside ABC-type transport system permease subunit